MRLRGALWGGSLPTREEPFQHLLLGQGHPGVTCYVLVWGSWAPRGGAGRLNGEVGTGTGGRFRRRGQERLQKP